MGALRAGVEAPRMGLRGRADMGKAVGVFEADRFRPVRITRLMTALRVTPSWPAM